MQVRHDQDYNMDIVVFEAGSDIELCGEFIRKYEPDRQYESPGTPAGFVIDLADTYDRYGEDRGGVHFPCKIVKDDATFVIDLLHTVRRDGVEGDKARAEDVWQEATQMVAA